jgi:integrase
MKQRFRHKWRVFKRAGAKTWYFTYWLGDRRLVRTTGQTTKGKAEAEAERFVAELEATQSGTIPTLREYAKNFFVWGQCQWIKARHEWGKRFSEDVASSRRGHLINHVFPQFGDLPLDKIERHEVRDWLLELPLSAQSKNHVLFSFRIVLRKAEEDGLIPFNPLEQIEPLGVKPKERDVFSLEELARLFPADRKKLVEIWKTPKHAALFFTLASTGLRSGEARALRWADVLWELSALHVSRAAKEGGRIGGLKTATPTRPDDRVVLLPRRTVDVLRWWSGQTKYSEPGHIVFYGENPDKPMQRRSVSAYLGPCLVRAKIDPAGRRLTPHSFRHGYVSLTRRVLGEATLRQLVGHKSQRVTDGYDHASLADRAASLAPAQKVLDGLFGGAIQAGVFPEQETTGG